MRGLLAMKKLYKVILMGSVLSVLTACGNTENQISKTNNIVTEEAVEDAIEDKKVDAVSETTDTIQYEESVEASKQRNNNLDAVSEITDTIEHDENVEVNELQNAGSSAVNQTTSQEGVNEKKELSDADNITSVLENLVGEYAYASDLGEGKLIIQKTEYGYDLSDYESDNAYRFLANSSNIDKIENNQIYIKYPAQVYSDNTAVFEYYILKYDTSEIEVSYSENENGMFKRLYSASRIK